jgi:hypothetical protein
MIGLDLVGQGKVLVSTRGTPSYEQIGIFALIWSLCPGSD